MDMTFKLQVFEGPLDLLLYLIEKNKVNIYDIPIVEITAQYMEYVNQMKKDNLDTLSEFLVMAATLLDIKSKMLLPKKEEEEQEQIRHRNRHDYLPDALELLKSDFPEGYELIQDYFLREDKVTMWYLVEKYGLSIDVVRYRIKIAKQKLKEYIILHENE